jgi:hypothetical protein
MSIPASTIVSVVPSVLAAGGNPLALNGLILSQNQNLPMGAPVSFSSLAAVQAYFGQYSWSGTATCVSNTLTIVSTTNGSLAVGQEIQSSMAVGVPPGTYITALGTYTSGTGVGTVTISGAGFTQASVSTMYSNCLESSMAAVYFNGFTASTLKPTALLFSRFPGVGGSVSNTYQGVPAFFRGSSMPNLTLAQVQAITSGTLNITINGTLVSIAALNLSSASSMSSAASLIQTAFAFAGADASSTVTWSSLFNAFVITAGLNATVGSAGSTSITVCSGTNAATLGLNAGTISTGSNVVSVSVFMSSLVLQTTNWAAFTTAYEPTTSDKQLLCAWTAGTGGEFVYAPYNTDTTIVSSGSSTTCMAYYCKINSYGGTCEVYVNPVYDPAGSAAAFVLGFIASLNYNATNGRAAISYKSGTGIPASVVDPTSFANAVSNGVNFYGQWATANSLFTFFWNGALTGPFAWLDSYVSAIWLNNALQLALINMFTVVNSVPYNNAGYAMIKAGCNSTLALALQNGVINKGVALTSAQAASVDSAAGIVIDPVLATTGWYLQVLPATGVQRANRQTPTCTLWYMDGGSVNSLTLASIDIQ